MKRFSFPFLLRLRGSRPKTARVFNRLGIDGSVVSDFDFAAWRCANRRHRLGETRSADAPDFRSDKRRIASLPIGFGFFFIFVSFFFFLCSFASQRQRWIFTAATGGHRFRIDPPYWVDPKQQNQDDQWRLFLFFSFDSGCNGVP